jgi:hypothetical protein
MAILFELIINQANKIASAAAALRDGLGRKKPFGVHALPIDQGW